MYCDVCKNELIITEVLEDGYSYWCPNCNGEIPLEKSVALDILKKYSDFIISKGRKYASKYSIIKVYSVPNHLF